MAGYCMSMKLYFHEPQASENTAYECRHVQQMSASYYLTALFIATTHQLQRDQSLPLSAKGVACETIFTCVQQVSNQVEPCSTLLRAAYFSVGKRMVTFPFKQSTFDIALLVVACKPDSSTRDSQTQPSQGPGGGNRFQHHWRRSACGWLGLACNQLCLPHLTLLDNTCANDG